MNITSKDLSFVIQGSIRDRTYLNYTNKLIKSVEKNLPGSNVIVSTFDSSLIKEISCKNIVVSNDPGSQICRPTDQIFNNVNRQIVSTNAGLLTVDTEYAVKIRNDMLLKNSSILKILNNLPIKRSGQFNVTEQFVIACNFSSVNPKKMLKLPYHPCDWFYAGLTKDIRNIWDIKLQTDTDANYFSRNSKFDESPHRRGDLNRFRPEAFIWKSFLEKHRSISFDHSYDLSKDSISVSNKYLAYNLSIYSLNRLGLKSQKYTQKIDSKSKMFSMLDYRILLDDNKIKNSFPTMDFEALVVSLYRFLTKSDN
jgi:hypothetical protein